ncbi:MAG: hypothetical protein ACFFAH_06395 [Promethearchaeota archaeon]
MTIDALKFFQAYLIEMIDVGGENLPRTISTKLGAKLGKIYKNKGILDLETGLKQIYKVLKGSPQIKKIDDNKYEVKLKYRKNFCPMGGKFNPEKAELIQQSLCYPFTKSFLNELNPNFNYQAEIISCILNSHKGFCLYKLNLEGKDK